MIDDYKIIKTLGAGMIGTTYLITNNDNKGDKGDKKYALKIEKILEKDVKKSTKSFTWREIEFCKFMNKKYPGLFMTLYDYDIIDLCNHEQKYALDLKNFPKKVQKDLKKVADSPFCSRKIYSLIDNTLQNELKEKKIKSKEEVLSIMIQLSYLIYLMHLHNYTHNDIHLGNIGIIYTKNKTMDIFGYKIPLYGRQMQLIDYGIIMNSKYDLGKWSFGKESDAYYYNLYLELFDVLSNLLFTSPTLDKFWIKNKFDGDQYTNNCKLILDSPEGKIIQKLIKPNLEDSKINKDFNQKLKFIVSDALLLLDNKKWQEYILNTNKEKLEKPTNFKPLKIEFFFDLEDYLFLINHSITSYIKQKKQIIKYYINKLL